ncbi:MAG TPA: RNA polymerase sigma factor [Candidatus Limnocylindria bacterium]|nr:RNA polymerase sigma factor [Candidatus Limnocylindria bacterium]
MDDRALVDAVLDGDRDAFRILVERESVVVYRACLRILGHPHDAEDVAQESFVIAYRSLASYRGDGPLGGWLLRIATRQAFRRLKQRPTVRLDDAPGLRQGHGEPDPLATAVRDESMRQIRELVARLSDPYREVVALRFFGELSLNEIAVATGRPLATVKTHLRRGLERLRSTIGAEEVSL